jgi:hypothetical protein
MNGYKKLRGAAQNFIHSFLSSMNYVEDVWVGQEIKRIFLNSKNKRADLNLIHFEESAAIFQVPIIVKGFENYKGMLKEQVEYQDSDPEKIKEIRVTLVKDPNRGLRYEGKMIDDRGVETDLKVMWE